MVERNVSSADSDVNAKSTREEYIEIMLAEVTSDRASVLVLMLSNRSGTVRLLQHFWRILLLLNKGFGKR